MCSVPLLRRRVPEGPRRGQACCCPQGPCAGPGGWVGVTRLLRMLSSQWRGCKQIKGGIFSADFKAFHKRVWYHWLVFNVLCVVSSSERRSRSLPGYSDKVHVLQPLSGLVWDGWLLSALKLSSGGCWSMYCAWHR